MTHSSTPTPLESRAAGPLSGRVRVPGDKSISHRALILGERTFGKGSVQTILPLGNGAAVKLTTARYYTPNGRSIQAEGIKPDIELKSLKVAADNEADPALVKESDLTGHLRNDGGNGATPPAPAQPSTEPGAADNDLAQNDYPLYEALNMLKGMTLLQSRTEPAAAPAAGQGDKS